METESRNMEWTGVLSVIERQMYKDNSKFDLGKIDGTSCETSVTLVSRLGETIRKRRRLAAEIGRVDEEDEAPKQGWFASWSAAGIQRTIELVGVKRTKTAVYNSSEGMKIVLGRLRNGGIKGVLEGMRHDRMLIAGGGGAMTSASDYEHEAPVWKQVWQQGQKNEKEHNDEDEY